MPHAIPCQRRMNKTTQPALRRWPHARGTFRSGHNKRGHDLVSNTLGLLSHPAAHQKIPLVCKGLERSWYHISLESLWSRSLPPHLATKYTQYKLETDEAADLAHNMRLRPRSRPRLESRPLSPHSPVPFLVHRGFSTSSRKGITMH